MINLSLPTIETELKPRITVFGIGGAGGNAVNNMIRSNLEGVEFVVGNTDAQALNGSLAQKRLQLGVTITRGLGAGSRPDVGRAAAEEQIDEINSYLDNTHMVFITAGMGGGTGTGAAPVIARAARERGILTVGVVTKPFHFEGAHRMRLAEAGIAELQTFVDTLIIIPNQNLFRIANEKTTFADAFKLADDVLHSGVRGVTDLMVMPGLINLDFADIRSVMTEMGKAMMGTGEATGERRSVEAAEAAISNPLLDDVSMKGARGVLINITGGYDMTLFEVDEAANRIRDEVDPDANIIFGSTFDSTLEGHMRVSVVATGIDAQLMQQPKGAAPALSLVSDRGRPAAPAVAATPRPVDYHATLVQAPTQPPAAVAQAAGSAAVARVVEPEVVKPAEPVQDAAESVSPPNLRTIVTEPESRPAPEPARSAAPLRGERKNGQFLPPRPVEVGPRPVQPVLPSEGFAAPRGSNAPEPHADKTARRGISLFERVTGLGGGARRAKDVPEVDSEKTMVSAPRSQPHAPVAHAQQRLQIDSPERTKMTAAEEDVLDIPAFLRRQAN
ncbi:MAG: cell division protein FtsZ [Azospirillum sp.]|nr:cell division protein FtsZ [Azospirillum sp.]